jgi:hypothetical protein
MNTITWEKSSELYVDFEITEKKKGKTLLTKKLLIIKV